MKWLTPQEYADKVGKSRQWVYLQVELGRLKSRKVRNKELVLEIAVDKNEETPNLG